MLVGWLVGWLVGQLVSWLDKYIHHVAQIKHIDNSQIKISKVIGHLKIV